MKIVVLLYIHTDEWTGGEIEQIFLGDQHVRLVIEFGEFFVGYTDIPGVIVIGRRVPKWAKSKRGLDVNATTCFPGDPNGNRDERYAWFVTVMCRGADLVIDVHQTRSKGCEVSIVGPYGWHNMLVRGAASLLGAAMCVYPAPHPAGVLPNYIGFDLLGDSRALARLYDWVRQIASGQHPRVVPMHAYRFAGDVSAADAQALGLKRRYRAFESLPDRLADELGLIAPVRALHWDADAYEKRSGAYGELFVWYLY